MSTLISEPRLTATKFHNFRCSENMRAVETFFKVIPASNWSLEAYINYVLENTDVVLNFEQVFFNFKESVDQINQIFTVPVSVSNIVVTNLLSPQTLTGKCVIETCHKFFDAKILLKKKIAIKAVIEETVNVSTHTIAYQTYLQQGETSNKRKIEIDEYVDDDEGQITLFDENNEDVLIGNINEDELINENVLPLMDSAEVDNEVNIHTDFIEELTTSFEIYRSKIPISKKAITLGYWGVIDLTKESLYNAKDLDDSLMENISKDFSRKLKWNPKPAPKNLQKYFTNNCNDDLEELKMSTMFPFYRDVIDNNVIKDKWGENVSHSNTDARNENNNPFNKSRIGHKVDMLGTLIRTPIKAEVLFGEVSGGIGPFGFPAASKKKRFLDKVKLGVIMRDSLNILLKNWRHINDNERRKLTIYGWTQHGLDVNIYAMQWYGNKMYLFGMLDKAVIPSSNDNCLLFEELYCVLKELEVKLTKTEEVIKDLNNMNMIGKRRHIAVENSPMLNINRTPQS
ncbi:9387_t:CDS:2 [Funneliformis caledonium]|uniref:9387_t:CDS:1 n=1 Tax=Funneliformis caledonium TaxID=1117310 RepID=A0A9N9DLX7_9GLOM|nr:9387_t:CDS:2 [Funneliformis caledonium]